MSAGGIDLSEGSAHLRVFPSATALFRAQIGHFVHVLTPSQARPPANAPANTECVQAISAATINGAHALGCGERVGSLEPGKCADLLVLNAGHYRDLQHSLGTNLVHLTMKRGRFIYKEGEVAPLMADDLPPHI